MMEELAGKEGGEDYRTFWEAFGRQIKCAPAPPARTYRSACAPETCQLLRPWTLAPFVCCAPRHKPSRRRAVMSADIA
jgi:hypothetical protein